MAYYPLQGKFYLDKTNIFVSYLGQTQTENASTTHLGKYDYMVASATTPATDASAVNFQFKHLGALVRLKVKMKEASTLTYAALQTDENDFITSGYIDLTAATPTVNPTYNGYKSNTFGINLNNITVDANQDLIVYFLMAPANLEGKTLKAIIEKNNGYYQEILLTGKNFEAGKPYELTATMASEEEEPFVVNVKEAGTFLENDYWFLWEYTSLKITGNLNGSDIRFLRKLAGRKEDGTATTGKLTYLDLTDANIVAGGDYYYKTKYGTEYKTTNNVAGDYMFYFCNLKTIKFPSTITQIGKEVCSHLPTPLGNENENGTHIGTFTSIIIPLGVSVINNLAFAWNQNLTTIEIPNSVKEIGGQVFYRCDALTTVNVPNSVEKMSFTFNWAKGLKYVHLSENPNYKTITGITFDGCTSLETLTIPANIKNIESSAFESSSNSALKELHFKSSTPPNAYNLSLPATCKIYVPQGSYDAYKSSDSFKKFTIIEE